MAAGKNIQQKIFCRRFLLSHGVCGRVDTALRANSQRSYYAVCSFLNKSSRCIPLLTHPARRAALHARADGRERRRARATARNRPSPRVSSISTATAREGSERRVGYPRSRPARAPETERAANYPRSNAARIFAAADRRAARHGRRDRDEQLERVSLRGARPLSDRSRARARHRGAAFGRVRLFISRHQPPSAHASSPPPFRHASSLTPALLLDAVPLHRTSPR